MDEEQIMLELGLSLEKFKKDISKASILIDKLDTTVGFKISKSDMDKYAKDSNAIFQKVAKQNTRIEINELKQAILARDKANKKAFSYREQLARKEYSRRAQELKEIEAKKIASEKWQYNLRVNSIKQENAIALSETKKRLAKEEKAYNKTAAGAWNNGTSFGHKMVTTSMYASAGAALYTMASGIRSVIAESMRFDDAIYSNMAVLNANKEEAESLAKSNRKLAITYGGSIEEIDRLL